MDEDQVDVVADATGSASTVGTNNDARLALLASINDGLDAQRGEDYVDIVDIDSGATAPFNGATKTPEQVEADAAADDAAAQTARAAAEAGDQEEGPETQLITRVVNGKQVTKTLEQWLATATKVEAADAYLAQAKQSARTEQPAPPSPEDVARLRDEEDLRIARAIQMGTEEEALAGIRALRQQTPSTDEITDRVAAKVNSQLLRDKALEKFKSDFADVWEDPLLRSLAVARDNELRDPAHPEHIFDYSERYAAVGKELRGWVEAQAQKMGFQPTAAAPQTSTKPPVDRLARKQAIPQVPRTASTRPAAPEPDDPELTHSQVIEQMRDARGGPAWMRGMNVK
jgi:hypothetical protein